jgi:hypothetical protein
VVENAVEKCLEALGFSVLDTTESATWERLITNVYYLVYNTFLTTKTAFGSTNQTDLKGYLKDLEYYNQQQRIYH